MAILNFGSLNIDIFYEVEKIVEPGETIKAISREFRLGGKGFNQSVALKKTGADVVHAGKIGCDGEMFIKKLNELGVETKYISHSKKSSCGHAVVQVDKSGENSIILYSGANMEIGIAEIDKVLNNFGETDFLLLQNEISNIDYILKKASERKIKTAINLAPAGNNLLSLPLEYADYLIMNAKEGAYIAQSNNPIETIKKLSQKYPKTSLVLTMGCKGYYIYDGGKLIKGKAYSVKPVDTTGAGDTFIGYFLSGVVEGKTVQSAADFAAKAASLSVMVKGSSASIPMRKDVENAKLYYAE